MLALDDDAHATTATSGPAAESSLTVEPGEIVTLIGANGAGQDHDAPHDSRRRAAAPGHRHLQRRSGWTALATDRIVRLGHRPVAGGPPDLPAHDRAREPRDGRLRPYRPRRRSRPTSSACSPSSRACGARAPRRAARCPAASSRCWPSGARSWRGRACSCSTSRRWASSPILVDADLQDRPGHQSPGHHDPARRSRTPAWRCASRIGDTSSRPDASCSRTRPPSCSARTSSGRPHSARSSR